MTEAASLWIRKVVHGMLLLPPINVVGKFLLKRLHSSSVYTGKYVFPAVGRLPIRYIDGHDFYLYSEGTDTIASRVYFGDAFSFERATAKVLTDFFRVSRSFFDVGAHTGLYSVMAATFKNMREVHAFDPEPRVFSMLVRNAELNGFSNIHPQNKGVAESPGHLEFVVPHGVTLPKGGSLQGSEKFSNLGSHSTLKIECISLDDYIQKNGIESCDLIKIDVETAEVGVLKGAEKTIQKFRPVIICEIIREQVAKEIETIMTRHRYKFYHLEDDGARPLQHLEPDYVNVNFLFVPEEIGLEKALAGQRGN